MVHCRGSSVWIAVLPSPSNSLCRSPSSSILSNRYFKKSTEEVLIARISKISNRIAEFRCLFLATIPGSLSKGLSIEEGEFLLRKSVKLAVEARDDLWKHLQKNSKHNYNHALVAASVGSYGAYLADGSEYSGHYRTDVNLEKLKDFHRRRLQVLVDASPDLLAFETIPNKLEAQALDELLDEENIQIPSWICFSSVDGEHTSSGESFKECLDILNRSDRISVVGINCASPQIIENLILEFRKLTKKAVAVYPNSGEVWNGRAKRWLPSECLEITVLKCLQRDGGTQVLVL